MEFFDYEIDLGTQSLTILVSRPQIVPLPPGLFTLASTVLSLSRGWQMRNPLHVRTEELRGALEGSHPPVANDVFALNAEEILSTRMRRPDCSELPQPFAGLSAELVSILALYDAKAGTAQPGRGLIRRMAGRDITSPPARVRALCGASRQSRARPARGTGCCAPPPAPPVP